MSQNHISIYLIIFLCTWVAPLCAFNDMLIYHKKIFKKITWLSLLRNVAFSIIFKHFNSHIKICRFRSFLTFWVEGELCSIQPCNWYLQVWELPHIVIKHHQFFRNQLERIYIQFYLYNYGMHQPILRKSDAYQEKPMILICHTNLGFIKKWHKVWACIKAYSCHTQ
jgi:hypothetical protein